MGGINNSIRMAGQLKQMQAAQDAKTNKEQLQFMEFVRTRTMANATPNVPAPRSKPQPPNVQGPPTQEQAADNARQFPQLQGDTYGGIAESQIRTNERLAQNPGPIKVNRAALYKDIKGYLKAFQNGIDLDELPGGREIVEMMISTAETDWEEYTRQVSIMGELFTKKYPDRQAVARGIQTGQLQQDLADAAKGDIQEGFAAQRRRQILETQQGIRDRAMSAAQTRPGSLLEGGGAGFTKDQAATIRGALGTAAAPQDRLEQPPLSNLRQQERALRNYANNLLATGGESTEIQDVTTEANRFQALAEQEERQQAMQRATAGIRELPHPGDNPSAASWRRYMMNRSRILTAEIGALSRMRPSLENDRLLDSKRQELNNLNTRAADIRVSSPDDATGVIVNEGFGSGTSYSARPPASLTVFSWPDGGEQGVDMRDPVAVNEALAQGAVPANRVDLNQLNSQQRRKLRQSEAKIVQRLSNLGGLTETIKRAGGGADTIRRTLTDTLARGLSTLGAKELADRAAVTGTGLTQPELANLRLRIQTLTAQNISVISGEQSGRFTDTERAITAQTLGLSRALTTLPDMLGVIEGLMTLDLMEADSLAYLEKVDFKFPLVKTNGELRPDADAQKQKVFRVLTGVLRMDREAAIRTLGHIQRHQTMLRALGIDPERRALIEQKRMRGRR
jgi:hypothetical protein